MKLFYLLTFSCAALGWTKVALVIIDTQECFLEQGSLPVEASFIIPKINAIRTQKDCLFDLIVRTQDFHPSGHISFGSAHGIPSETPNGANSWRASMSMQCVSLGEGKPSCCPANYIDRSLVPSCSSDLYGLEYCPAAGYYNAATNLMIKDNVACSLCKTSPGNCFDMKMDLWLDHCLEDGDSKFAKGLVTKDSDVVVQKGVRHLEMFSGFMDNTRTYSSDLDATLRANGITEIVVAGIATTHCVRWTLQDGVHLGYKTSVIMDASAGIWGTPTSYQDEAEAIQSFTDQGITVLHVEDILAMPCLTCGEVKKAYKDSMCCGNPNSPFSLSQMRRLLSDPSEPSAIEKDFRKALKQAKAKAGVTAAKYLEQNISALLRPFL